jgi:hypothetical protein
LVSPATSKSSKMPSYTVTLEKTEDGWRAWCQTLPQCRGEGKNQKQAYMAIKKSVRNYIRECFRKGKPVPMDRTTTKFFRVKLEVLREPAELR